MKKKLPKMISFVNSEGATVAFSDSMTIEDLAKLGVREITLTPKENPPPKDPTIYTHTP